MGNERAVPEGVVVLGVPRSATTLLRRLLDAHPRIFCAAETNVFTACGRFLRSPRIADGTRLGVLEGLAFAGIGSDEVLQRLRDLAFGFLRDGARRAGKPRWAAKTAFDVFYLDELEALWGDRLKFVCIQRHGLDTACSLQELSDHNGGYLPELHEYVVRHPIVLEAFAHLWVERTRALHAFVRRHPRHSLLIGYEELTADADAVMTRVMAFIGEKWKPALAKAALERRDNLGLGDWKTYARTAIDSASVGRWKKLPRATIVRLAEICNPTLQDCGYEPVVGGGEPGGADGRRRYELGLLVQGMKAVAKRKAEPKPTRKRRRTAR